MGPLGIPELLFILVLALLIFGPKRLPQVGRTLGKGMAEFRKASNELRRTLNTEALEAELRENDPRRMVKEAIDAAKPKWKDPVEEPTEESTPENGGTENTGTENTGTENGAETPRAAGAPGSVPRGTSTAKPVETETSDVGSGSDEPVLSSNDPS